MTRALPFLASLGLVGLLSWPAGRGQETGKLEPRLSHPFFPLELGNKWVYQVTKNKVKAPAVTMTVDKYEKVTVTYKTPQKKEGDKEAKVEDVTVEEVCCRLTGTAGKGTLHEHVAVREDGIFRFRVEGKEIAPPFKFFKLPLQKGESWTCDCVSEGVALKGTFTSDEATITVPAGQFSTMYVGCKDFRFGAKSMELEIWFAQKVGIVKRRVKIGKDVHEEELEKFVPAK